MERYLDSETAAKYDIKGMPSLVRLAWNIALLFPDYGDEIIADLCDDLRTIVGLEEARMAREAQAAAHEKARSFWVESLRRAAAQNAKRAAAAVSAITPDGIDPLGCFVYLLWARKDDPVPVYVGQSRNLFSRLAQHMQNPEKRYSTGWVTVVRCPDEDAMNETEAALISHYQPPLNKAGTRR